MDLDTDDEVLHLLADGEAMDYSQWPGLVERLISRLRKIVHDDFPAPSPLRQPPTLLSSQPIPSSPPVPTSLQPSQVNEITSQDNDVPNDLTNKENAPPLPPNCAATFPSHIQSLLDSISKTLRDLFIKYPPHTIQRFAELILRPRQHYKNLYSYLHAVDRVVHVTSGANVFPLPPAVPDPSAASVLSNGASIADITSIAWAKSTSTTQANLGSDESLGGALLTPIAWLSKNSSHHISDLEGEVRTESTETIEGPNGPGGIETVSVSVNGISSATPATTSLASVSDHTTASLRAEGGVTQGELLRQEQKAGVVPAAQLANHGRGDTEGKGEEEEVPHARGPEEIGMEDMGPQNSNIHAPERGASGVVNMRAIDVEAAVGRKGDVPESMDKDDKEDSDATGRKVELDSPENGVGDNDQGIVAEVEMIDVDGRGADEKKANEAVENTES